MDFNLLPRRLRRVAVLGLSLMLLGGCQPLVMGERQDLASGNRLQKDDPFVQRFQAILSREASARNEAGLSGVVDLRMTLDAQSQVLDCAVRSRAPRASQHQQLTDWVTDICWNSLFPPAPPAFFANAQGSRVVQVAVMFLPRSEMSYEKKQQRKLAHQQYRLSRFFRQYVLAWEPIESVGEAHFNVIANAQGRVSDCQVTLAPSASRASAFKDDSALAQRLSAQCKRLNLRQMPGFASDADGVVSRQVSVEYSPWLKGLPPR